MLTATVKQPKGTPMSQRTHISPLRLIFAIGVLFMGMSQTLLVSAQTTEYYFFDYGNGLGLNGYDPVAYFTLDRPRRGNPEFSFNLGDREWRFISERHLEQFKADPDKYLPQFGSHCAYGASRGYLVRGDPEAWTVYRGKLYVNYNKGVRRTWLRDIDRNIAKANRNFPNIIP